MDTGIDAWEGERGITARILRAANLFDGWPPSALAELLQDARLVRLRRGEHLSPEDPHVREVAFIGAGSMDVVATSSKGRCLLVGIFGPGHILGLLRLLPGRPMAYDYRAREATVAVRLSSDVLMQVLQADPARWASVALMALRQYKSALHSMTVRSIGDMSARIAVVLNILVDLHGVPGEDGIRLRVRVSQEDLACMLNTTRQTVNKELQVLASEGILSLDYSAFVIRDLERLRDRFEYHG